MVKEFHQFLGDHSAFVETWSSWVLEYLGFFEVLVSSEDVAVEVVEVALVGKVAV